MASVAVDALLGHLESPETASFMKNDNLSTILENLRFLRAFLEDPPQQFDTNGLLANLESMANEATSIISSFDVEKMDNDMAQEMNSRLGSLEYKIEQVKKEGKKAYDQIQKPPRSNFPTTEHVNFIDYLMENLRELLKHKAASVALLKHQIATVADLLPSLKAHCVMDIEELDEDEELSPTQTEELHKRNEEFKELRTRIMRVVYEIEYVTDCYLCRVGSTWYHKFWLSDILEEIRLIMKANVKIYDKESIVEHLISELEQQEVVSILHVPAAGVSSSWKICGIFKHWMY